MQFALNSFIKLDLHTEIMRFQGDSYGLGVTQHPDREFVLCGCEARSFLIVR
jgi:hypothetical protein